MPVIGAHTIVHGLLTIVLALAYAAEQALLPGGGDALVVTLVGQVARVASFPMETPGCPTDPAAEQATTTLGAP
jgi:hypothetical protein